MPDVGRTVDDSHRNTLNVGVVADRSRVPRLKYSCELLILLVAGVEPATFRFQMGIFCRTSPFELVRLD